MLHSFDYKVYVACSLTHAPEEFRASVESFKDKLRSICTVFCFYGLGKRLSGYEVYLWDIHECVRKSDLVVAICDLPSIGLGYEIGTQVEARRMPCLAIAQEHSLFTDLLMDIRQPGYEFRRYKDLQTDAVALVADKLRRMYEVEQMQLLLFPELDRMRRVA